MSPVTWDDLENENAMTVVGTVSRLVKRIGREIGEDAIVKEAEAYAADALSGDYDHLMDASHAIARKYLETTLDVPEFR